MDWLDNKTRKVALEKAELMHIHLAYPDELLDDKKLEMFYQNLDLTSNNYLLNIHNITIFNTENQFEILRKPVNKSEWFSLPTAAEVNAWSFLDRNSLRE